jgi:hypothetical protein
LTKGYHEEITADKFKHWFLNRFINYLEESSIIIIMGNATYCSVTMNKEPNTSARKKISIGWNRKVILLKTGTRIEL